MSPPPIDRDSAALGDFDALLAGLDSPSELLMVASGYATLMESINSADYRRCCEQVSR